MITRLHGPASTIVANPHRFRRNPEQLSLGLGSPAPKKHRKKRGTKRAKLRALPSGARKVAYLVRRKSTSKKTGKTRTYLRSTRKLGRKKPAFTLYARGKGKTRHYGIQKNPRHTRRNPDLVIAGVPVIPMAIGSAGAIAAVAVINGFLNKKDTATQKTMFDSIPGFGPKADGTAGALAEYKAALAPALLAAGSAFAYKKAPAGMYKDVAKYAFIGSVFLVVQNSVGAKIEKAVTKTEGIYMDPSNPGARHVGGMYQQVHGHRMHGQMGGMYMTASGQAQADMGGLGLFKAKSIYG